MKTKIILILFSLGLGCGETVTSRYPDRAAAVNDGAIVRGWLPEWLPPSASKIYEEHDLDTNRSSAFFCYASGDEPKLPATCVSVPSSRINTETNAWVAPKGAQPFEYFDCQEMIQPGRPGVLRVAIDRGRREVYLQR